MAVTVREYWGTLSGTRADFQKYIQAQDVAYRAFRDRTSESAMNSALVGIGISIISSFFKKSAPGIVAGALYAVVGAIDAQGKIANANILDNGKTVLAEIYDALNRDSSYQRIEATVFFREYTDSSGKVIRAVYGNSTTKGKNSGAYQINRIQLTNGNWLTS